MTGKGLSTESIQSHLSLQSQSDPGRLKGDCEQSVRGPEEKECFGKGASA
jgi:hypothetical protein